MVEIGGEGEQGGQNNAKSGSERNSREVMSRKKRKKNCSSVNQQPAGAEAGKEGGGNPSGEVSNEFHGKGGAIDGIVGD